MVIKGKHHSEESKNKISITGKGRIPWNKGKTGVYSEETRRKMSQSKIGKCLSEAHKKKLSENNVGMFGKHHSEETRHKISESGVGKHHITEEEKKRLSVLNMGRMVSEITRSKIPNGNKGKIRTESTKNKLSESHKGKPGWFTDKKRPEISGINNYNWRGGISYEPYCHKFNNELKERIRDRDYRTCQLCGVKENGRKLDVHHIQYDKKNCSPDLISLCLGCHRKVNHNRDYWETYFQDLLTKRGLLL